MAMSEKFRRERHDRPRMHRFARVMVVLGILQVVLATGLHIMHSVATAVWICIGVAALVCGALAAFKWPDSRAFRNVVRSVLIGAPIVVLALGVFSAIYASSYNPDSSAQDNWMLYGSIAVQFTQPLLVFGLPALVIAASFGARVDRVFLNIVAVLNAACVAFVTYYMAGDMNLVTFSVDHAVVKAAYMAFAVVFMGMTFAPALGNDPDRKL